jgi:3-oxoadipate enol-lactonase
MKVVLLHGWPLTERMWASQTETLRDAGFDPVTPYLYGRGASIDDWASEILGEVYGPIVPVGASMGGYVALALARRAPERVLGMALVSSRADADTWDRRREREYLIADLHDGVRPEDADPDISLEHLAKAQAAMRDRLDLTGVVASFGGPLLVCVGEQDALLPVEEARALAASALDGRFEAIAGAEHFPSLDAPRAFNAVLLDFLGQWRT